MPIGIPMTCSTRRVAVAGLGMGSEGKALDMEIPPRDTGPANALLDRARHRGRAADVDVALGDIGGETSQVFRREQTFSARGGVVADDVVQRDPATVRELLELVGEDDG